MTPAKKTLCYEYFSCTNASCPAYKDPHSTCWLLDGCNCVHNAELAGQDKGFICVSCPVFERSDDIGGVKAFLRKRYAAMVAREHLANERNSALTDSFFRMAEVIEKLCLGDPTARVGVTTDNFLIRKLEEGINKLAESIAQNVADSHEMAIGICEHYDALIKIAEGDLTVKASESSCNEIIAQLGVLINRGTSSLITTINQLRETDEKLTLIHRQMHDIIDFLPDATFVVNRHGEIISWNKAMEELTGKSKIEMLGKHQLSYSTVVYQESRPILINFLDKDLDEIRRHYTYVKRVGEKLFAESHILRPEGEDDLYHWVTAAPLIDKFGNRIGAVESIRDITDYRRAEIDRTNLEHQLRQSQKMEAIGLLAGGIAHDFNNLLTAVIGYTALLQSKIEPESELQGYLEQIALGTDRATKLTQDLLSFSRKRVLNPEMLNINEVVFSINGLLSRLLTEDIQLCFRLNEGPLFVLIDKGMIEQVLLNLVANARDSMPQGGEVTVRTAIEHHPEGACVKGLRSGTSYAVISVIDTGYGMDQAICEKIFEPFFTTKELGKGTGLGLSTVYGIVSQHEGSIGVESEPGKGSIFRIYLPLLEQPNAGPSVSASLERKAFCGGTETVLLVEDDAAAQRVKSKILSLAGYRVITANNGAEAVERYRAEGDRIGLVVMDVIMPVMNGRAAYDEMLLLNPRVRCLFTSGYTADIIHQKGRIDKTFDFLPKPSTPQELLGTIRTILDRP